MRDQTAPTRRQLLQTTTGLAAAGLLAGCTGGDGGNGSDGSDGGDGSDGRNGGDGSDGSDGGDGGDETYEYNMATASSGGSWAVQGAGLAEMWNEHDRIQITAINTAGGGENPILIRDGEAGLGFQSGSNLYAVLNGEGPYDEAIELQSVYRTNTNPIWYAVRDGSEMTTIADLDGKRVAVGPRGSNANYESTLFFDHVGIDIEPQYLSFSDAANAMANEQIDSMIVYGLIPAIQQLAEQIDIRPLEYGDAYDSLLSEFPWAVESTFPAAVVDWWDEETPMIGKDVHIVCRPDLPEELTYEITRITFENVEDAREIHVLFSGMNVEDAARDLDGNIDLHSGSERYFEEAGVL